MPLLCEVVACIILYPKYNVSSIVCHSCGDIAFLSAGALGMRYISLGATLFGFWLLLSGPFSFEHPTLFVYAAISIALCMFLAWKMQLVDEEGHPVHLLIGALTYMPWLLIEIIKSSLHVTRVILSPSLPIAPSMFKVKASQKSRVGVNVYGNSITLTPGTITVAVDGNELEIHALTKDTAADLKSGGMDKRVSQFEGSK